MNSRVGAKRVCAVLTVLMDSGSVLAYWVRLVAGRGKESEECLQAVPGPTEELRRDQNPVVAPDQVLDRGLESEIETWHLTTERVPPCPSDAESV